jgi:prevent-host-death family protein
MKQMPAGEFKAKCLRVMEEVKKYRTPVVITKKGKPVVKLVPADEPKRDIFGCMEGKVWATGDIENTSVFPPLEQWDVVRGRDWLTRREPRVRRKKREPRKRSR